VVQLKRFKTVQRHGFGKNSAASMNSYKLCNVIDIPEQLDLTDFVSPDAHADGDAEAQDLPKILRPEELEKLTADVAKLEVSTCTRARWCGTRTHARTHTRARTHACIRTRARSSA
jgi:hypothetical protein